MSQAKGEKTTNWYQEIFETAAWHRIHDGFWKARDPSKHAKLLAERLELKAGSVESDMRELPKGEAPVRISSRRNRHMGFAVGEGRDSQHGRPEVLRELLVLRSDESASLAA